MNAVIYLDVPDWQIGQDVSVYFPDTMLKHGKCELLKEQEAKTGHWNGPECSHCHAILERACRFFKYCPYCGAKMENVESW